MGSQFYCRLLVGCTGLWILIEDYKLRPPPPLQPAVHFLLRNRRAVFRGLSVRFYSVLRVAFLIVHAVVRLRKLELV